ncbi:MAG: hypothetical protein [Podoviridae sp. ctg2L5]|nr:MAG: hypothetical protein [Podoviridae sp. ctg2L5]
MPGNFLKMPRSASLKVNADVLKNYPSMVQVSLVQNTGTRMGIYLLLRGRIGIFPRF